MSVGFWTLDRVAAALANEAVGRLPRGAASMNGITTDTRKIAKGDYLTYANCTPDEKLKIVQVRRAQDELVRATEPA